MEMSECPECGMEMPFKDIHAHRLWTHQKHRPGYECGLCQKTFRTMQDLKAHMVDHTVARPLMAELASHALPKQPRRRASTITKACAECGESFTSDTKLIKHIRAAHRERVDYMCEVCGKRYSTQPTWTNTGRHTWLPAPYSPRLRRPRVPLTLAAAKSSLWGPTVQ